MNIVFIEGVCGAGKSTIIKELAQKLPALTIPELPKFNRSLLSSFTSEKNIKNNFMKYLDHETIREHVFSSHKINEIAYVIADRSYISIVALALSMEDYIGREFIGMIISKVIENIENTSYFIPNKVIVMCASYNNIYRRNINKEKKMDTIWTDKNRINSQVEFYNYLIEHKLAIPVSTDQELYMSLDDCIKECQQSKSTLTKEDLINGLRQYKQYYV